MQLLSPLQQLDELPKPLQSSLGLFSRLQPKKNRVSIRAIERGEKVSRPRASR
jgi:hypothetical protein